MTLLHGERRFTDLARASDQARKAFVAAKAAERLSKPSRAAARRNVIFNLGDVAMTWRAGKGLQEKAMEAYGNVQRWLAKKGACMEWQEFWPFKQCLMKTEDAHVPWSGVFLAAT